jgi:type IV pilus assembly protein PilW
MFAIEISKSKQPATHAAGVDCQSGLTLIELMIAMVIGVFLLMGTMTVFTQSRTNFRVADSIARLQENARFAIDTIEPDLRLARFWGRNADPAKVVPVIPVAVVVTCDTVADDAATYTAWVLRVTDEIAAVDDTSGYANAALGIPCAPATVAQPDSDALVVRHASGQPIAPTNNVIQIHVDHDRGDLFNNGVVPLGYNATAQTHNVVTNVYYVDQGSDLDPNVPSLRMKTLVQGGIHQDQELVSGVENLQVQFGVDTNEDNIVERYVDANHAIINPTAAGFLVDAKIISVRLWMLMRANAQENGFQDRASYTTPDISLGGAAAATIDTCAEGVGCNYPDNFRRLAVSKTIFLRNNRWVAL